MRGLDRFRDRTQAGKLLGERLLEADMHEPLLLALPRGGVPVASAAARVLGAPMEVLVVRKLGVPWHEELGMGAISEDGHAVLDQNTVDHVGCLEEDVERVIEREKREVARRVKQYRGGRPLPSLAGRTAVIVDDGVAMGVTARAACGFARSAGAAKVLLAVPVCSAMAAERLRQDADELVCLQEPEDFYAVGRFYEDFDQVSDEEVLRLLATAGGGPLPKGA